MTQVSNLACHLVSLSRFCSTSGKEMNVSRGPVIWLLLRTQLVEIHDILREYRLLESLFSINLTDCIPEST